MNKFKEKDKYDIDDLIEIVKILRSENGCPWDRKQTHESLRTGLIEETYEVIEAIDKKDTDLLKEELGDVLLQIVFHADLEEEKGTFNFSDVADEICKKMVVRHPHVFGNEKVADVDEVLQNWENIKLKTKSQTKAQSMENIAKTLPALLKSKKIHQKFKRLGLTCTEFKDIMHLIDESYSVLCSSVLAGDESAYEKVFGDFAFYMAGLSVAMNIDPELATQKACDRYLEKSDI